MWARLSIMLVATATATAVFGAAAPPISAAPRPRMRVSVGVVPGGLRACAKGSIEPAPPSPPNWELRLSGTRGDGSVIDMVLNGTDPVFEPPCLTVLKNTTTEGSFTATLSYSRVASDGWADAVVANGSWDRLTGDHGTAMTSCEHGCLLDG